MTALVFLLRPETLMMGVYCKPWALATFFCAGLTMAVLCGSRWSWLWLAALGATVSLYGAVCAYWLWLIYPLNKAIRQIAAAALLALALNPQLVLHWRSALAIASLPAHTDHLAILRHALRENFLTLPGLLLIPTLFFSAWDAWLGDEDSVTMWLMLGPAFLVVGLVVGEYSYRLLPLYPLMAMLAWRGAHAKPELAL